MTKVKGKTPSDDDISAIYRAVGEGLDAWSRVEQALERLFVALTTADVWDAHLVMVSVVSFDARLKICNNLMQRRRKLKAFESWDALYNKLDRKYRKRNELAHGSVVQINDKALLVPYFTVGRSMARYIGKRANEVTAPKGLTPKQIQERAKGFRTLAATLSQFSADLVLEREKLQKAGARK